jgi:hypothetical protein
LPGWNIWRIFGSIGHLRVATPLANPAFLYLPLTSSIFQAAALGDSHRDTAGESYYEIDGDSYRRRWA